jgi:hypothetical protein
LLMALQSCSQDFITNAAQAPQRTIQEPCGSGGLPSSDICSVTYHKLLKEEGIFDRPVIMDWELFAAGALAYAGPNADCRRLGWSISTARVLAHAD